MSSAGSGSSELVLRSGAGALVASSEQKSIKKKPPKKPMEEEQFTEALTTIIRRDFFPDVAKLEAQLEFIEASESNDYDKLREISERFATTTHTPAVATPATFETPSVSATPRSRGKQREKQQNEGPGENENSEDQPPEAKKPKPEEAKLDQFLSKYQSEDDASFGELMEKAAEEHRQKHAWLRAKEKEYADPLSLEGPEQRQAITDGGSEGGGGAGGGGSGEGGKMMIEHRPAGVKTWNYTAKNTLMYIPEGVEESTMDRVRKATKGREIVHSNTRLSRDFIKKREAAVRAMASSGEEGEKGGGPSKNKSEKIGVDGKTLAPGETPSVNGYDFIFTPQIHPGVDASPLMTWGTIDGTPFHLETDLTPHSGPTFKMPKAPRREELAHKLVEKTAKANKERKKAAAMAASPALLRQKLGATPTSDRLQMLSPAARKLVARTATPTGIDKSLRASYTPKRTPISASPHFTPLSKSHSDSTPRHHAEGGSTPSLTDNLLNLR